MVVVKPSPSDPAALVPIWLEVVRLGRTDWRVSDSRIESADPSRLVGFIEKLSNSRFELVWMTYPVRWGYAHTLSAALGGMAEGARFAGATAERDPAVPMRAPTSFRRIRRRTASDNDFSSSDVA